MVAHLRNPGMYTSVSAFAPIVNPVAVPWGEKVRIRLIVRDSIPLLISVGLHWVSRLC